MSNSGGNGNFRLPLDKAAGISDNQGQQPVTLDSIVRSLGGVPSSARECHIRRTGFPSPKHQRRNSSANSKKEGEIVTTGDGKVDETFQALGRYVDQIDANKLLPQESFRWTEDEDDESISDHSALAMLVYILRKQNPILSAQRKLITRVVQKLQVRNKRITQLFSDHQDLMGSLKDQANSSALRILELESMQVDLEGKLTRTESEHKLQVEQQQVTVKEMQNENLRLYQQLAHAQHENDQRTQQVSSLKKKVQETEDLLRDAREGQQSTLNKCQQELSTMHAKRVEIESSLNSKIEILEHSLETVQSGLENLGEEKQQLQLTLDEKTLRLDEALENIQNLKEELEKQATGDRDQTVLLESTTFKAVYSAAKKAFSSIETGEERKEPKRIEREPKYQNDSSEFSESQESSDSGTELTSEDGLQPVTKFPKRLPGSSDIQRRRHTTLGFQEPIPKDRIQLKSSGRRNKQTDKPVRLQRRRRVSSPETSENHFPNVDSCVDKNDMFTSKGEFSHENSAQVTHNSRMHSTQRFLDSLPDYISKIAVSSDRLVHLSERGKEEIGRHESYSLAIEDSRVLLQKMHFELQRAVDRYNVENSRSRMLTRLLQDKHTELESLQRRSEGDLTLAKASLRTLQVKYDYAMTRQGKVASRLLQITRLRVQQAILRKRFLYWATKSRRQTEMIQKFHRITKKLLGPRKHSVRSSFKAWQGNAFRMSHRDGNRKRIAVASTLQRNLITVSFSTLRRATLRRAFGKFKRNSFFEGRQRDVALRASAFAFELKKQSKRHRYFHRWTLYVRRRIWKQYCSQTLCEVLNKLVIRRLKGVFTRWAFHSSIGTTKADLAKRVLCSALQVESKKLNQRALLRAGFSALVGLGEAAHLQRTALVSARRSACLSIACALKNKRLWELKVVWEHWLQHLSKKQSAESAGKVLARMVERIARGFKQSAFTKLVWNVRESRVDLDLDSVHEMLERERMYRMDQLSRQHSRLLRQVSRVMVRVWQQKSQNACRFAFHQWRFRSNQIAFLREHERIMTLKDSSCLQYRKQWGINLIGFLVIQKSWRPMVSHGFQMLKSNVTDWRLRQRQLARMSFHFKHFYQHRTKVAFRKLLAHSEASRTKEIAVQRMAFWFQVPFAPRIRLSLSFYHWLNVAQYERHNEQQIFLARSKQLRRIMNKLGQKKLTRGFQRWRLAVKDICLRESAVITGELEQSLETVDIKLQQHGALMVMKLLLRSRMARMHKHLRLWYRVTTARAQRYRMLGTCLQSVLSCRLHRLLRRGFHRIVAWSVSSRTTERVSDMTGRWNLKLSQQKARRCLWAWHRYASTSALYTKHVKELSEYENMVNEFRFIVSKKENESNLAKQDVQGLRLHIVKQGAVFLKWILREKPDAKLVWRCFCAWKLFASLSKSNRVLSRVTFSKEISKMLVRKLRRKHALVLWKCFEGERPSAVLTSSKHLHPSVSPLPANSVGINDLLKPKIENQEMPRRKQKGTTNSAFANYSQRVRNENELFYASDLRHSPRIATSRSLAVPNSRSYAQGHHSTHVGQRVETTNETMEGAWQPWENGRSSWQAQFEGLQEAHLSDTPSVEEQKVFPEQTFLESRSVPSAGTSIGSHHRELSRSVRSTSNSPTVFPVPASFVGDADSLFPASPLESVHSRAASRADSPASCASQRIEENFLHQGQGFQLETPPNYENGTSLGSVGSNRYLSLSPQKHFSRQGFHVESPQSLESVTSLASLASHYPRTSPDIQHVYTAPRLAVPSPSTSPMGSSVGSVSHTNADRVSRSPFQQYSSLKLDSPSSLQSGLRYPPSSVSSIGHLNSSSSLASTSTHHLDGGDESAGDPRMFYNHADVFHEESPKSISSLSSLGSSKKTEDGLRSAGGASNTSPVSHRALGGSNRAVGAFALQEHEGGSGSYTHQESLHHGQPRPTMATFRHQSTPQRETFTGDSSQSLKSQVVRGSGNNGDQIPVGAAHDNRGLQLTGNIDKSPSQVEDSLSLEQKLFTRSTGDHEPLVSQRGSSIVGQPSRDMESGLGNKVFPMGQHRVMPRGPANMEHQRVPTMQTNTEQQRVPTMRTNTGQQRVPEFEGKSTYQPVQPHRIGGFAHSTSPMVESLNSNPSKFNMSSVHSANEAAAQAWAVASGNSQSTSTYFRESHQDSKKTHSPPARGLNSTQSTPFLASNMSPYHGSQRTWGDSGDTLIEMKKAIEEQRSALAQTKKDLEVTRQELKKSQETQVKLIELELRAEEGSSEVVEDLLVLSNSGRKANKLGLPSPFRGIRHSNETSSDDEDTLRDSRMRLSAMSHSSNDLRHHTFHDDSDE